MWSLTAFCGALGVRARTSHFARFGAVLPFSASYGLARQPQSPTAAGGRVDSTGAIDSDVFISHRLRCAAFDSGDSTHGCDSVLPSPFPRGANRVFN